MLQEARLVQRVPYNGMYVKDFSGSFRYFSDDSVRSRYGEFKVKMYYWDGSIEARRYTYYAGLILGDDRFPKYKDTTTIGSFGGGVDFPAPDPAKRHDSIEISFGIYDLNDPKFKQALYIDELVLTYASAAVPNYKLAEGKLYPNPATGRVYIDFQRSAYRDIEVLDLQGKVLYKTNTTGTSILLELNDLVPGLYLVRCSSDEGISLHKFVKQ